LPEITLRALLLSIILAAILAAANTYLALKIGILTSASIPAAVISMGVLRFFKNSNILENNQVQTAASAGEAVAGGIVYTIPALVIINYWSGFSYLENFLIAITGGLLGVLFSVPIRRVLMQEPTLKFPEGRAIAELLKAGSHKGFGLKEMLWGGGVGGLLELLQSGFKIVAEGAQYFFAKGSTLFGFGIGFSATMLGAGYLVGFTVGISFLVGAIINWVICLPALSTFYAVTVEHNQVTNTVMNFAHIKLRYVGIGAMLLAGVYTLLSLAKPFAVSLRHSLQLKVIKSQIRTEQDLPMSFIIIGLILLSLALYGLFDYLLPITQLGFAAFTVPFIGCCILYVLVIGFIFSAICGYFSGMVGVSASPGSAIIIAGMLMVALTLRMLLGDVAVSAKLQSAAAITIILGGIVTGAACIANDNIQDLKVGHLVGSTPRKQQLMLMLGVVVAAAVIPLVMQLLYKVYGIAGNVPRAGMDPSATLPAPPAALMAAVTQAVFNHDLPWEMMGLGMLIVALLIGINHFLQKHGFNLSILGVAIGMYLPLTTSVPLFFGGLIAYLVNKKTKQQSPEARQRGNLLACGLVAGSALMDVLLAIPMALLPNPDVLNLMPANLKPVSIIMAILLLLGLASWFKRLANRG
jgi:putative OPT family oligopeptide transporter